VPRHSVCAATGTSLLGLSSLPVSGQAVRVPGGLVKPTLQPLEPSHRCIGEKSCKAQGSQDMAERSVLWSCLPVQLAGLSSAVPQLPSGFCKDRSCSTSAVCLSLRACRSSALGACDRHCCFTP